MALCLSQFDKVRTTSMSPFSRYLVDLRRRLGVRQGELADLLGYDQSYLSALEIGQKGPPTPEFVDRLAKTLELSEEEQRVLFATADASERKLTISPKADEEIYLLLRDLRDKLPQLSAAQIRVIREMLRFHDPEPSNCSIRSRIQSKQEARM